MALRYIYLIVEKADQKEPVLGFNEEFESKTAIKFTPLKFRLALSI